MIKPGTHLERTVNLFNFVSDSKSHNFYKITMNNILLIILLAVRLRVAGGTGDKKEPSSKPQNNKWKRNGLNSTWKSFYSFLGGNENEQNKAEGQTNTQALNTSFHSQQSLGFNSSMLNIRQAEDLRRSETKTESLNRLNRGLLSRHSVDAPGGLEDSLASIQQDRNGMIVPRTPGSYLHRSILGTIGREDARRSFISYDGKFPSSELVKKLKNAPLALDKLVIYCNSSNYAKYKKLMVDLATWISFSSVDKQVLDAINKLYTDFDEYIYNLKNEKTASGERSRVLLSGYAQHDRLVQSLLFLKVLLEQQLKRDNTRSDETTINTIIDCIGAIYDVLYANMQRSYPSAVIRELEVGNEVDASFTRSVSKTLIHTEEVSNLKTRVLSLLKKAVSNDNDKKSLPELDQLVQDIYDKAESFLKNEIEKASILKSLCYMLIDLNLFLEAGIYGKDTNEKHSYEWYRYPTKLFNRLVTSLDSFHEILTLNNTGKELKMACKIMKSALRGFEEDGDSMKYVLFSLKANKSAKDQEIVYHYRPAFKINRFDLGKIARVSRVLESAVNYFRKTEEYLTIVNYNETIASELDKIKIILILMFDGAVYIYNNTPPMDDMYIYQDDVYNKLISKLQFHLMTIKKIVLISQRDENLLGVRKAAHDFLTSLKNLELEDNKLVEFVKYDSMPAKKLGPIYSYAKHSSYDFTQLKSYKVITNLPLPRVTGESKYDGDSVFLRGKLKVFTRKQNNFNLSTSLQPQLTRRSLIPNEDYYVPKNQQTFQKNDSHQLKPLTEVDEECLSHSRLIQEAVPLTQLLYTQAVDRPADSHLSNEFMSFALSLDNLISQASAILYNKQQYKHLNVYFKKPILDKLVTSASNIDQLTDESNKSLFASHTTKLRQVYEDIIKFTSQSDISNNIIVEYIMLDNQMECSKSIGPRFESLLDSNAVKVQIVQNLKSLEVITNQGILKLVLGQKFTALDNINKIMAQVAKLDGVNANTLKMVQRATKMILNFYTKTNIPDYTSSLDSNSELNELFDLLKLLRTQVMSEGNNEGLNDINLSYIDVLEKFTKGNPKYLNEEEAKIPKFKGESRENDDLDLQLAQNDPSTLQVTYYKKNKEASNNRFVTTSSNNLPISRQNHINKTSVSEALLANALSTDTPKLRRIRILVLIEAVDCKAGPSFIDSDQDETYVHKLI